jgi:hypothetical protein
MKKTIFTVAVPMQDQEQCDRMKAVCLENGLPIPFDERNFILDINNKHFAYSEFQDLFFIFSEQTGKTQVTEAEFLELLKEYKDGTQVHD